MTLRDPGRLLRKSAVRTTAPVPTARIHQQNERSGAQDSTGALARFSLLGGPFHDTAARLGAGLGVGGAVAVGIGTSLLLWAVLAGLALADGQAATFFSQQSTAIHARLLLAVPLIFLCEKLFDQAVRDACRALASSDAIKGSARREIDAIAGQLVRLNTSWWLQLALFALVLVFSLFIPTEFLPGLTGSTESFGAAIGSLAGPWYWWVCLPFFRFAAARFLWLICLWSVLVWRLSRRDLKLTASHPDHAGGLGLFEVAQTRLLVFVLALAVIASASLAENFHRLPVDEAQIYLTGFLVAILGFLLITAPLLPLMRPRYRCRRVGLVEFGALGLSYSTRFQQRWLGAVVPQDADLLGSADIQSLADIGNAYQNVRSMRTLPVSNSLAVLILVTAAVPHAPLLLLKYPMGDLLSDLVQGMIGL